MAGELEKKAKSKGTIGDASVFRKSRGAKYREMIDEAIKRGPVKASEWKTHPSGTKSPARRRKVAPKKPIPKEPKIYTF